MLVGIVYLIIRVVTVKRNKLKVEWLKEIMKLLFTCYLTGLISLVVLPANFWLSFFDGIVVGFFIAYVIKDRKKEESKT